MIKKICLGVFGFEFGGLMMKLGAAHSLTESLVSQKLTFVIVDYCSYKIGAS